MRTMTPARPTALAMTRAARLAMLAAYAREASCPPLAPCAIRLPGGDNVQVDGATSDESVIVEIEEHEDPHHEGLRARSWQALMTLSLARSARPHARAVLLVASESVRDAVLAWLPAHLTDSIEVEVVHV